MIRIGWILLVLVVMGWIASEMPNSSEARPACDSVWRRTRDGWVHQDALQPARPPYVPPLHPGVVAALELMLSAGALLAWSPDQSGRAR